jgi:NADPH:quinone reductase-like Zn-dependent oxidoreductase
MSQQKALLLLEKRGEFVVGTRDIEKPGSGELLVKVLATALNPIDWKIQKYGLFYDVCRFSVFDQYLPNFITTDIPGSDWWGFCRRS